MFEFESTKHDRSINTHFNKKKAIYKQFSSSYEDFICIITKDRNV